MKVRRIWPFTLIAFSLLTALAALTGILPFLRPLLVFVFMLVCPGLAFVGLMRITGVVMILVLSIALSLALDTLVATILVYSGLYTYETGLLIIVGITLLGAVTGVALEPEQKVAVEEEN